jgi:hypothetical protein
MKFRVQAFSLHLLASITVLALVLGGLYLGWYRWPGWYLSNALKVAPILASVDLALGPLLTLLIANPRKARRELARDIGIIVAVQLVALGYGATTLWRGRPLYYAFSEDRLQLVQASDLDSREVALAVKLNSAFAPHWYSRPRWIWAPLPERADESAAIVASALGGGNDVIQMPRYFKPWEQGLPQLRAHLQSLDQQRDIRIATRARALRQRLAARGFAPDQALTMIMTGQGAPLLAVFDRDTLRVKALLRCDFRVPRGVGAR